MHRFSSMFDNNGGAIHQLVSEQISDWILFVFGPLGKNGIFENKDRSKAFDYLSGLSDLEKGVKFPSAIFPAASWEEYWRIRFADMYKKLSDPGIICTFNELGEGLLERIFVIMSKPEYYQYFSEFEDNQDRTIRYRGCNVYIPLIKRKHYDNLDEEIRNFSTEMYNEWLDNYCDEYEMEDSPERLTTEETKKDYIEYADAITRRMLFTPLAYVECSELEEYSEKLARIYNKEFCFPFCDSFVFWDCDYVFALVRLSDTVETDIFFSTIGKNMGMTANGVSSLYSLENDMIEKIPS